MGAAGILAAQDGGNATLRIHVSDPGARDVGKALVSLRGTNVPELKGATDDVGAFSFGVVTPGRYELTVERDGFEVERRDVTLAKAETKSLQIALRLTTVRGTVTVNATPGYQTETAVSATRMNSPILDVPQSIAVIGSSVLTDQQDFRFAEAGRYVSGVVRANTSTVGEIGNEFAIRGFTLDPNNNYLRDGIKYPGYGQSDTADVEQLEVLKGPASVLYGRAEAGGVVNLVSKKPLEAPLYSLQLTGGGYDFYRPQLDISGPVNRSHTFLYRFNGAYENRGSFRDSVIGERYYTAPAFSWRINSSTTLNFGGEWVNEDRVSDYGLPVVGNRPAQVPLSRFYDEPWNQEMDRDRQAGFTLNRRLGSKWSVNTSYRWSRQNARYLELYNTITLPGNLIRRTLDAYRFPTAFNYSQTDLTGTLKTGRVAHHLLVGFETGWTAPTSAGPRVRTTALAISIFNPVYGTLSRDQALALINNPSSPGYALPFGPSGSETDTHNSAGYLQDQVDFGRKWKVLLGVRFEGYHQDSINLPSPTLTTDNYTASPRAGVVYQPVSGVSLYGSFVQSFQPITASAVSRDHTPFAPEHARQFEAGVKTNSFRSKLSSTLAVYWIEKQNVLTTDPVDPTYSIQTGHVRSKGVEFDTRGSLSRGWSILLSYAFDQAQVTRDNVFAVGNTLANAPRHDGALWTTYEIPGGKLRALGVGAGISAVSLRYGESGDSFLLPGYMRTEATAFYKLARDNFDWRFSLNIKNALDRGYYESGTTTQIRPGAPLIAYLAVKVTRH